MTCQLQPQNHQTKDIENNKKLHRL